MDRSFVSVRSSNYHIMINTNQKFKDIQAVQDAIRCLYFALKNMFCNKEELKSLIRIHLDKRPGTSFDVDIGKITSEVSIEYAQTGLHSHILLQILHLTYVSLDLVFLKTRFMELFTSQSPRIPLKNTYIHVEVVKDNVGNVRDYIFKNVANKNVRMRSSWGEYPSVLQIKNNIVITNMSDSFSQSKEYTCEKHGSVPVRQPGGAVQFPFSGM